MISSGSLTSGIVDPDCPGCLPGLRPDEVRDELRAGLEYGGSDDGGLLEVEESLLKRRSNSATRAVSDSSSADWASIWPDWVSMWTAWPAITSRSLAFVVRNCATNTDNSAADGDSGSDTKP